MGSKIAQAFTDMMATWAFIFGILSACTVEIYGNARGYFHFDPTMIVLNTVLSLWAAVQGSIIMINGNEIAKRQAVAQQHRDDMMQKILDIEEAMNQHITQNTTWTLGNTQEPVWSEPIER